jgi:hypothetical protein
MVSGLGFWEGPQTVRKTVRFRISLSFNMLSLYASSSQFVASPHIVVCLSSETLWSFAENNGIWTKEVRRSEERERPLRLIMAKILDFIAQLVVLVKSLFIARVATSFLNFSSRRKRVDRKTQKNNYSSFSFSMYVSCFMWILILTTY